MSNPGEFSEEKRLYANSIVALNAATGQVVWSFQTVHDDLWDYDNASPPAVVTISRNGARVPAVIQATKTGMLFVLDRETGRPVLPVEERPVPASDIPTEQASRTNRLRPQHRRSARTASPPIRYGASRRPIVPRAAR